MRRKRKVVRKMRKNNKRKGQRYNREYLARTRRQEKEKRRGGKQQKGSRLSRNTG